MLSSEEIRIIFIKKLEQLSTLKELFLISKLILVDIRKMVHGTKFVEGLESGALPDTSIGQCSK
jgi:hypothetical protein